MKFHGEIQYDGEDSSGVHSDICWNCDPATDDKPITEDYRQFLHDCLDEWLNKSNGTGGFWIGDPEYFIGWGG